MTSELANRNFQRTIYELPEPVVVRKSNMPSEKFLTAQYIDINRRTEFLHSAFRDAFDINARRLAEAIPPEYIAGLEYGIEATFRIRQRLSIDPISDIPKEGEGNYPLVPNFATTVVYTGLKEIDGNQLIVECIVTPLLKEYECFNSLHNGKEDIINDYATEKVSIMTRFYPVQNASRTTLKERGLESLTEWDTYPHLVAEPINALGDLDCRYVFDPGECYPVYTDNDKKNALNHVLRILAFKGSDYEESCDRYSLVKFPVSVAFDVDFHPHGLVLRTSGHYTTIDDRLLIEFKRFSDGLRGKTKEIRDIVNEVSWVFDRFSSDNPALYQITEGDSDGTFSIQEFETKKQYSEEYKKYLEYLTVALKGIEKIGVPTNLGDLLVQEMLKLESDDGIRI